MRQWGVLLFVFLSLSAYWNIRVYQKKRRLAEIVKPFQDACRTPVGCTHAPLGWSKDNGDRYAKDDEPYGMIYSATETDFVVDWHIATDVHLIAKGGKSHAVVIDRVIE